MGLFLGTPSNARGGPEASSVERVGAELDQTAGATYGLTTMLTGVLLNVNVVTSLWLCARVAIVVRHAAVSGADGGVVREAARRRGAVRVGLGDDARALGTEVPAGDLVGRAVVDLGERDRAGDVRAAEVVLDGAVQQPTPVMVVAVNTLEPVSDWPSAMAIVWNAFSFMLGNWAMISPLETVTTPLASVVAALANGTAIAASATRETAVMMNLRICFPSGLGDHCDRRIPASVPCPRLARQDTIGSIRWQIEPGRRARVRQSGMPDPRQAKSTAPVALLIPRSREPSPRTLQR